MGDEQSNPAPILILGAGAFGLSTALSLLRRFPRSSTDPTPKHRLCIPAIHIIEASSTLPNPSGSSVDSSRIVRADYATPAYSSLARAAQRRWRDQGPEGWGGEGRYIESGFVLTADHDHDHPGCTDDSDPNSRKDGRGEESQRDHGKRYVEATLETVRAGQDQQQEHEFGQLEREGGESGQRTKREMIEELPDQASIRRVTGYPDAMGDSGYVNWGSGWADAEASIEFALEKLRRADTDDRVRILTGKRVERLILDPDPATSTSTTNPNPSVVLVTGEILESSLVVLATGAWTPILIDLRGRATATGQVLAYLPLTAAERSVLEKRPVVMNMSRGMFVMPPGGRRQELKLARHGYGYRNPRKVVAPALYRENKSRKRTESESKQGAGGETETGMVEISVPETGIPIPPEGEEACRETVRQAFALSTANPDPDPDPDSKMLEALAERPFSRTRICWYCDTYDYAFQPLSLPS